MPSSRTDQLSLHGIMLLFGLTAILGKLMTISALLVVCYRTLIASVFLAFIYFGAKKHHINRASIFPLMLVGSVLGLHWICFFGSARMSTVSLSLVTFSTTSFFTSILEPLSKKVPISKKELFLGVLVVFGMALIFNFERGHALAILVGLFGAFLSSVYSVANVNLAKKHSAVSINFFELFGAFLFSLILIIGLHFYEPQTIIPQKLDFVYLGILAILCTVLPYLVLIKLLRKLSAFSVNLVFNMEPIYGIFLAWIIFGKAEKMTTGFYAGAALIVLSLVLNFIWTQKKPSHF